MLRRQVRLLREDHLEGDPSRLSPRHDPDRSHTGMRQPCRVCEYHALGGVGVARDGTLMASLGYEGRQGRGQV